jgi:flagellar basal-body rod protein FlgB
MELFTESISTLETTLDLRMERQRIIAANLANLDTPGYKAVEMDFQASLDRALSGSADPVVTQESTASTLSLDGNNVVLETELGKMGQNKLMYSLTAQILAAKMRQLSMIFEQET